MVDPAIAELRRALEPFAAVARAAIEHGVDLPPPRLIPVQWNEGVGTLLRWRDFEAAIAALDPNPLLLGLQDGDG